MNAVEVCNLALGRIGEGASRPIQSLTEADESARACNRVFAQCLSALLREFPWPFAQASVLLAEVVQDVPGWEYVYAYPSDCLFLHGLSDEDVDPSVRTVYRTPYRILSATSGESRVIATNLQTAWAHYTRSITNPHFGDTLFQDALAWKVASEVALGLKADPNMARNAYEQYRIVLSQAVAANHNEQVREQADPEDVRAYGSADPWAERR